MKNFEQFKKDFKRDLLIKVVIGLKHGQTSKDKSAEIARNILEVFRNGEPAVVFQGINKLAETHPYILDIFIKRANEYDQRFVDEKIPQILIYLKPKRSAGPYFSPSGTIRTRLEERSMADLRISTNSPDQSGSLRDSKGGEIN